MQKMGSGLKTLLADIYSNVLLVVLQLGCRSPSQDQLHCNYAISSVDCFENGLITCAWYYLSAYDEAIKSRP